MAELKLYNAIKKLGILIIVLLVDPIVASVYGVLHDQVTYTIAPEYYTKFKFDQFGLETHWFGGIRNTVAITGIMATWWVGLFIGFVLGSAGFIYKTAGEMFKGVMKSILLVIIIAICVGLIGFIYACLFGDDNPSGWRIPTDLLDKKAFITVGYIHNFSYLGGLVGMIAGIVILVRNKRLQKHKSAPDAGLILPSAI